MSASIDTRRAAKQAGMASFREENEVEATTPILVLPFYESREYRGGMAINRNSSIGKLAEGALPDLNIFSCIMIRMDAAGLFFQRFPPRGSIRLRLPGCVGATCTGPLGGESSGRYQRLADLRVLSPSCNRRTALRPI